MLGLEPKVKELDAGVDFEKIEVFWAGGKDLFTPENWPKLKLLVVLKGFEDG